MSISTKEFTLQKKGATKATDPSTITSYYGIFTEPEWYVSPRDFEFKTRTVIKMPSDWRAQIPETAELMWIEIRVNVTGLLRGELHYCPSDITGLSDQARYESADTSAATKLQNITNSTITLFVDTQDGLDAVGSTGLLIEPTYRERETEAGSHGNIRIEKTATVVYLDPEKAPETTVTEPIDLSNRITDESLTVAWTYSQEASSPQTAYTIEKSTNNGITWESAASATSANTSHTFAANTFNGGQLWLRLTVSSAYAESDPVIVRVNMRANPATSDVSCDGKPVPTVSWTGADQSAYQVRFDTWDSGARFGDDESMTVPRVYPDGVYPVTVRTQTSNGEWSEWSETIWAEISNTDPGLTVSLTAVREAATVLTAWPAVTGAAWYALERDGIPVYAGTGLSFRDELAVGTPAYRLLAVTAGGYYTATDPVTVPLALRCDMLKALDDDTAAWIRIRWSLAPRSRSYDRSVDTTYRHYAGRPKPVAITGGAVTRTMRTTAAYKTRAEAEAILALAGRPVVYKDANGGRIIGILNPAGYDSEHVYSLDISVTEIDWPEEAEYVPAE